LQLFKKILFPVDLSHISPKIASYVSEVASKFEGEVHLLFVVDVLSHLTNTHLPHPTTENLEAEVAGEAEKRLQEFRKASFKFDSCKAKVVLGKPAEEILKYAKLEKIDLIIIGTHGRTRIASVRYGGVVERIVRNSPVPVLSVNPYGRSEDRESRSLEDSNCVSFR